jgi:hypothetical protein
MPDEATRSTHPARALENAGLFACGQQEKLSSARSCRSRFRWRIDEIRGEEGDNPVYPSYPQLASQQTSGSTSFDHLGAFWNREAKSLW